LKLGPFYARSPEKKKNVRRKKSPRTPGGHQKKPYANSARPGEMRNCQVNGRGDPETRAKSIQPLQKGSGLVGAEKTFS